MSMVEPADRKNLNAEKKASIAAVKLQRELLEGSKVKKAQKKVQSTMKMRRGARP